MSGRLEGHHIAVTGGSRGIGAAIVRKVLAEGARASFVDVEEDLGRQTVAELAAPGRVLFVPGDIRRADDIAAFHEAAVAAFGPVTGLVNNAGRNANFNPATMTEAEWDEFMSVDFKSAWLCARAVLPEMIAAKRGSIVNIASIHADMTYPGYFPYAAAKTGLVGLTRSLALEVGPQQIRVNALSPGWTETNILVEYFARVDPDARARVLAAHPMNRMGQPGEIANVAAFLLSDEASFVSGVNWRVDGAFGARFAG